MLTLKIYCYTMHYNVGEVFQSLSDTLLNRKYCYMKCLYCFFYVFIENK